MPIPAEIRKVPRPVNTIVIAYGKNKDRYAVRKRIGCKYVDGKRKPINGPTIGHIVDGRFIPLPEKTPDNTDAAPIVMKDWGNAVLCDRLFKDMMQELLAVFSQEDAEKIYCIAVLLACNEDIRADEFQDAYDDSFLSELYPGVVLDADAVRMCLKRLGSNQSGIFTFMKNRAAAVPADHNLLVDGFLRTTCSAAGSSLWGKKKVKTNEQQKIPVLYAFDMEEMELVCAGAFPGKTLEAGSFSDFVTQNNISRGFIAAGKGLTPADAQKAIKPDSKVYCLNSVSRKSSLVGQCGLLDFSAYLPEYDTVLYLKKNFDGKWLYSYRNPDEALREEKEWMRQAEKNNSYSFEAFSRKRKEFGTFFFESDIELPPEIPYIIFEKQAEIKMVMSSCNAVCGPDAAGMSDGGYIAGREFCVFMSSVLVFRLLKAFGTANLLADRTFGNLMSVLSCIRKTRINNGDWQLIRINSSQLKILEALKLSPAQGKASGKRGRPRDRKTRKQ